MQVIPAINAKNFKKAKELIVTAKKFLPKKEQWIQVDVSDGKFSAVKSWSNPEELADLMNKTLKVEAHLMVENPEVDAESWLKSGVKRLAVHLEALRDFCKLLKIFDKHKADLMLAINPETTAENLIPYLCEVKYFLILAVTPGESGQKFQPVVLEKIRFLRELAPDAKIEVDGGINLETAALAKEAGADIIVSGSYVFNSPDPAAAYEQLENV